jgi:hypothetical protein
MLPSPLSGDQRIILAVRRAFGSYIFIYRRVTEKTGCPTNRKRLNYKVSRVSPLRRLTLADRQAAVTTNENSSAA